MIAPIRRGDANAQVVSEVASVRLDDRQRCHQTSRAGEAQAMSLYFCFGNDPEFTELVDGCDGSATKRSEPAG